LAIVIVAALLWYLGIFNPSGLVGSGNSAKGFTFNVLEQKYSDTTLDLRIGNTQGQKVSVTGITLGTGSIAAAVELNPGEAKVITSTGVDVCGDDGTPGQKYVDKLVVITYDTVGGITNKTDSGTISGVCS